MARFAAVLLAAAVAALLAAGRLTHAAPSTAEVFWRAVLPGSAVPDAVLRFLRPDNFVSKAEAEGAGRPSAPFDYQNYERSSTRRSRDDTPFSYDYKAPGKGAASGGGSRDDTLFGFGYKAPSNGAVAGGGARADTPFGYDYKAPGKGAAGGGGSRDDGFGYDYKAPSKGAAGGGGSRDDGFGYDKAPSKGAAGGGGSRDDGFGYDYKAPSNGAVAGGGARADTPFAYDYKATGAHRHADGDAPASATTTVFFHEEAVRVGERLAFRFPAAAPAPLGLLPRHVADAIPFAAPALPSVLALLGVAPGSARAAAMAETLRACETPPLAGEPKFCATSLEALVERAVAALGTRDVRAVTSTLPRAGAPLQPYTVRAVRPVGGGGASFVACHDEAYPYTVYRCHGTGPARAYMVEMEGARGGAVTLATVCHTDTSRWNPEHVSFKLLGTKPGGAPICHLMPYGHVIWVKNEKRSPA